MSEKPEVNTDREINKTQYNMHVNATMQKTEIKLNGYLDMVGRWGGGMGGGGSTELQIRRTNNPERSPIKCEPSRNQEVAR